MSDCSTNVEKFAKRFDAKQFMIPDAHRDFSRLLGLFCERIPFRFLRFSDGEVEILRNNRLEITPTQMHIRNETVGHELPPYDVKRFDPATGHDLRADLLTSAAHRAVRYFKGVPARHNGALPDRDLLVDLNGGMDEYMTFADLLLNSNYKRFLKEFVPVIRERADVYVLGNFRMKPELLNPSWTLLPIPDNFFSDYNSAKKKLQAEVECLKFDSVLLASASTLSNIAGYLTETRRPDVTLIDIGTSLHALMGLDAVTRDYHLENEPWSLGTVMRKVKYRRSRHFTMQW